MKVVSALIRPATTANGSGPWPVGQCVYCRTMRIVVLGLGVVVACFGVLWALQGFGVVGGSPMSNTTTWSIIGPITAVVGIAIAGFGARMRK